MALRTPERKAAVAGHLPAVLLPALLALAVTGCATVKKPAAVRRPAELLPGFERIESGFGITVQYSAPAQADQGYETLEVYLSNVGKAPARCLTVWLDGEKLPWAGAPAGLPAIALATAGPELAPGLPQGITWWQCYPSPTVGRDETMVVQVNFRLLRRGQLKLEFDDGRRLAIAIPPFRRPGKEITALTWAPDYSRLYVQYRAGGSVPWRVWLNGRPAGKWQRLISGDVGPEALSAALPGAVVEGQPVAVRLQFEDGEVRQALVRAYAGIGLDAYALNRMETNRPALGLDRDPGVRLLKTKGGDVACADAKANGDGTVAMALVAERAVTYANDRRHLSAVHYCTSMRPPLWNVYGGLTDAVYANPYRFSYGNATGRYLEDEETAMTRAWLSARPRPWLYMPETFRKKDRFLEFEEVRTLAWVALLRGCKGLSPFAYDLPSQQGYKDAPQLAKALPAFFDELRSHAAILAPLFPVSARAVEVKDGWIKVYVGWAGEQGLLVAVRNLDYEVDARPAGSSSEKAFRPRAKNDVTVPVAVPPWCRPAQAVAWAGKDVKLERASAGWTLRLGRLDAITVAWLPNGAANAPVGQPAASAGKN